MPPKPEKNTGVTGKDFLRREFLAVALVLLVAAAFRAAYLIEYKANAPYHFSVIADSTYYDNWASRVAAGHGYGPKPFYMAPLYPYLLALVFRIAGHTHTAVYAVQMLLGLANLLLTYLLGRRLFGDVSGLAAMVLLALYAPIAYLESKLLTETLAVTLNLASLLLLISAVSKPSKMRFLIAGVFLGLSAVCRPVAILTIGFVLVWLVLLRSPKGRGLGGRHLAVLIAGIALTILPVTARNLIVGRDFALISTNGGIVFAQGNNPRADGVFAIVPGFTGSIMNQQDQEIEIARKAFGHPVTPSEASGFWFRVGLNFIREQPGEFLGLLARKALWSVHNREAECSYNVYLERTLVPTLRWLFLPFSVLAGMALFGLVVSRRERRSPETGLLRLYVASVFLSLVIFTIHSRFRVPAAPALAVFAGFGIVTLAQSTRMRGLVLAAACLIAFPLISLVPYPVPAITETALANLGSSYLALGEAEKAIPVLKEALALAPDYASPHSTLGSALVLMGDLDEAIAHYERAISLTPGDVAVRVNLGRALTWRGRARDAVAQFQEALRLKPDSAQAHAGLAEAFLALGRAKEAVRERDTANRMNPILARDLHNLGLRLHSRGRLRAAIWELKAAIALRPDYAEAHCVLGLALKDAGRLRGAITEYREALRINPKLVRAHNNLAIALYYSKDYSGAWEEVRASRRLGGSPHPGFLKALSEKTPQRTE